jgi:hypothetical protein
MKTSKFTMKDVGMIVCWALLSLLFVPCCYGGLIVLALVDVKTPIEKIRLNNDQTITIWYETDVQHPNPSVHYRIVQGVRVIVPATQFMFDTTYRSSSGYEIEVAYAQDGTLVCVYDPEYWEEGFLILYDTQNGDSWSSRRSTDEHWKALYAQLRDENPGLPAVPRLLADDD